MEVPIIICFTMPLAISIATAYGFLQPTGFTGGRTQFYLIEVMYLVTACSLVFAVMAALPAGHGTASLVIIWGMYLVVGGFYGAKLVRDRSNGGSLRTRTVVAGMICGSSIMSMVFLAACWMLAERGVRRPSHTLGEFTAVRHLHQWSIGGVQVFTDNTLSVIPTSQQHNRQMIGEGARQQMIVLGIPIVQEGEQFRLGEFDYDSANTRKYILQTKLKSQDPDDKIWAIQSLWVEPYPGHIEDVEALTQDNHDGVRQAAEKWLERMSQSP